MVRCKFRLIRLFGRFAPQIGQDIAHLLAADVVRDAANLGVEPLRLLEWW